MKDKLKILVHKKYFHLCVVIVIIAIMLAILGFVVLKYNVEGETNMPFNISKISIISSQEGMDKENAEYKWAFDVCQNNDIFVYVKKNDEFDKQEAIENVTISNINVEKNIEEGNIKFYKPTMDEEKLYTNSAENEVQELVYAGEMESNLKQCKISNQGGVISFRYSIENLVEFLSNDEEINHNELLKKSNVIEESLSAKLKFEITIKTVSGKEYKAEVALDLPIKGVVEDGTTSYEITDLTDVIFKRVKN